MKCKDPVTKQIGFHGMSQGLLVAVAHLCLRGGDLIQLQSPIYVESVFPILNMGCLHEDRLYHAKQEHVGRLLKHMFLLWFACFCCCCCCCCCFFFQVWCTSAWTEPFEKHTLLTSNKLGLQHKNTTTKHNQTTTKTQPPGCRFFSGAETRLFRRLERVEAKGKARRLVMVGKMMI